jgi:hypothetical protein
MKNSNKIEWLVGVWEKEFPIFFFDNEKGIVEFKTRESQIDLAHKIIKFKKEDLQIAFPSDPYYCGLKCPECNKKTLVGHWKNYLPLFEDKNAKQVVVISDILTKDLSTVNFCPDCGIFINPQKEFELMQGGKKEAIEGINNKMLASITYSKYLKKGAIVGGLVIMVLIIGLFAYQILMHKIESDVPLVFVLPLCAFFGFLVGTPFGALIGVIVGRKVNKANDRPPF